MKSYVCALMQHELYPVSLAVLGKEDRQFFSLSLVVPNSDALNEQFQKHHVT